MASAAPAGDVGEMEAALDERLAGLRRRIWKAILKQKGINVMHRYLKMIVVGWLIVTAVGLMACAESTPTSTPQPMTVQPTAAPSPVQTLARPTAVPTYPAETYTATVQPPPASTAYPAPETAANAPVYGYRIINQYPHDATAFTQGLVWLDGVFYEGTGLYGRSSLRRVNPETGEVQQMIDLPEQFFGEGIVVWEERIIQITWKEQTAFVYDRETFEQIGEFSYATEGWGITHDGRQLLMSDGTNTLTFRDPETFAELRQIQVFDGDVPVTQLNELEYITGEIWANIWMTERIARIDPQTGRVTAWVDLTGLRPPETLNDADAVLNGIAYNPAGDRLFVTGKRWPTLFEIELVPTAP
ncbi:MAG: glutaminyl-peptide cyclotransferase [Chloroflexi bacterium]|nr:glutaminyl-peptide cyclotransferase [Chloroflexota bacterium]MCI0576258.1 glutaminyl-peptide cyclotransferase [Chloroflexota bacterium]MCI0644546.1 glutaminyl-peptide cyclotransferase [Chloroflexota bacterium]MCI0728765.1 glutaminyl-peptide cyclotransferase [Chloroflexota bacterium]